MRRLVCVALMLWATAAWAGANNCDQTTPCDVQSNVVTKAGANLTGSPHFVFGRETMSGGTDAVSLTNGSAYSSSSSYVCSGNDLTSATVPSFMPSAGNAFTITATGTDSVNFLCFGN